MGSVHVGVRHDDDLVVPQLCRVEVVPHPGAEGLDHGADLLVGQHLVEARFLDVEDLAPERKDRLERPVPALLGAASCRVSLHDVDLAVFRAFARAVRQFSRKAHPRHGRLADQLPRTLRGFPGLPGLDGLFHHRLHHLWVVLEPGEQSFIDDRVDDPLHIAVSELRLRLPLELRIGQLYRHHAREPFLEVFTREILVLFLQEFFSPCSFVHTPGESRPEAGDMCSPLDGVDEVREPEDTLEVPVIVLQTQIHRGAVLLTGYGDRLGEEHGLSAVQVFDERLHASVVLVLLDFLLPLVLEDDGKARVQECQFPQPCTQHIGRVFDLFENFAVGHEMHQCPVLFRWSPLRKVGHGNSPFEPLGPGLPVPADGDHEPFGKGVHHGDPYAVEPSAHLVGGIVELSPRMEGRQHHLGRGTSVGGVRVGGDPPAVVLDRNAFIRVDRYVNSRAIPADGLVNRVVHHFVDQVVKPPGSRIADVHSRTFADGLQPLQDLDAACRVLPGSRTHCHDLFPPVRLRKGTVFSLASLRKALYLLASVSGLKPVASNDPSRR